MTDSEKRLLKILFDCGGYYECPKDKDGNRLGPLVGYAGTYDNDKHYVGDVYCNMAMVEENPEALVEYAKEINNKLIMAQISFWQVEKIFGIPNGGTFLAYALASQMGLKAGYMEYEEIQGQGRKDKRFFLGRHEIKRGEQVIICEDICNNFSSTERVINVFEEAGAKVVAIVCGINRSLDYQESYKGIPIIAAVNKPFSEYKQDDPEVAQDIARGNIIWKPKNQWNELMLAMTQRQVS